jgi:hypothetical protein
MMRDAEMRYSSYSIMDRAFGAAAFRMRTDRASWITTALDALYEAQRRQAITDIRRHRHLFPCPQHLALDDEAYSRTIPARRQAISPTGATLPMLMMQGALMTVLALFFYLLLHVLA